MTNFLNDFKVGARLALKKPGSVFFAVVAYAIGLGLVALMLALIFGVAQGKPDFKDIDRIYTFQWDPDTEHLWEQGNQFSQWRIFTFEDFESTQESFEAMSASSNMRMSVMRNGYAELVQGMGVTADFFETLGVQPHIGRFLNEDEGGPDSPKVAVLGYDYWMNEFGGGQDVLGESLIVNGVSYSVIGVARKGFDFPAEAEMWIPRVRAPLEKRGEGQGYLVTGRLKPGVDLGQANAEFNTIAKNLEQTYPDTNTGFISVRIDPLASMYMGEDIRALFNIMLACSGLVLLIACANVANLLLSRTILRTRELAIRSSLGATRSRLVMQMLVEGFVIALLGGLGGWGVGAYASKAVWQFVVNAEGVQLPSWMSMELDLRVMLVLVLTTIVACVVAGLLPALKASKTNMNEILKDSGRSSTSLSIGWFSRGLVFLQLSFSLGLLVTTGAMVKTVTSSEQYDPPYDTSRMLFGRLDLNKESYPVGPKQVEFRRLLKEKLEAIPGVEAAGFSSSWDMMFNWDSVFEIEGAEYARKEDYPHLRNEVVSNDYFENMGIPILEGRGFLDTDTPESQSVVLVNTHLAEKFWPGESAVGKRMRDVWSDEFPWVTVVGVIPDTEMLGPGATDEAERAGMYQPMSQKGDLGGFTVYVYAERDAYSLATPMRKALAEIDQQLTFYRVKTVEKAVKDNQFGNYFFRNMFGMFGVAALILASIGVYGVMSFSVNQRMPEYGIRLSLGAKAKDVIKHILYRGSLLIGVGIVSGTLLGAVLLIAIRSGMNNLVSDVYSYIIPIVILTLVSFAALIVPSIGVKKIHLVDTLRD